MSRFCWTLPHIVKNLQIGRGNDHTVEENREENVEAPHIAIIDETTRHYRRFGIEGREMRVQIRSPPSGANVYEGLESAMQELYGKLCAAATSEDFIGVTLSSEDFFTVLHGFHLDA